MYAVVIHIAPVTGWIHNFAVSLELLGWFPMPELSYLRRLAVTLYSYLAVYASCNGVNLDRTGYSLHMFCLQLVSWYVNGNGEVKLLQMVFGTVEKAVTGVLWEGLLAGMLAGRG